MRKNIALVSIGLAAMLSASVPAFAQEEDAVLVPGVNIIADDASPTGYFAAFVLEDDGYDSVQINGNFSFAPVITEETDCDIEYIPQMDENGMAIKDENNKSILELGRDMSDEPDNVKADTLRVDDDELPIIYSAFDWAKEIEYEGTTTTLDHWTSILTYNMQLEGDSWVIRIPLPSGRYEYTYNVSKKGKNSTIKDPANQEQWWTLKVPTAQDLDLEGDIAQSYLQAYAYNEEDTVSYAYVPFDAEKQSQDWTYLSPVSEKQYEGTIEVDVAYSTLTNVLIAPEVAEAYENGESDADGTVDFIREENNICIYLPGGYDPEREEPYNVVYFADGGRGGQRVRSDLIRIADHAMADGVDDFLIVTFNAYASATDKAWPSWFDWKVLANITQNIIPFMEENYNVGTDESSRAICGFSAGGGVSHYALLYYSDWFDYFGCWGCGESTTVPGDFNAYVKYIHSYEQYKDAGLEDENVLLSVGSYDVKRAGGYTVEGTKDAVQTIRYDHTFRAFQGLRDVIGVQHLEWLNGHSNHDDVTGNYDAYYFFNNYLWK